MGYVQKTCSVCGGSGRYSGSCSSCGGSGRYSDGNSCVTCGGTGTGQCGNCYGKGYKEEYVSDSDSSSSSSYSGSSSSYSGGGGSSRPQEPDKGTLIWREGVQLLEAGNYDKAILKLTQSINAGGINKGTAYNSRGYCYIQKGNYDQAIDDYTEALNIGYAYNVRDKNTADAYYNRAVCYNKKGDKDQAIADYKKAADLGDQDALKSLANMGIQYTTKNGISNAEEVERAKLNAKNAELDQKIKTGTATIEELQEGISNLHQGAREIVESSQEQEALKILNSGTMSAVELCKMADKYWIGFGSGEDRILKNIPIATKLYTKAAEMGSCMAMRNLGHIYRNQKYYEKAFYWYGKAIEQNDFPAMYALAFLYRDGEGVQTDYNKAEELLNQAIQHYTKPDDSDDKEGIEVKFIKQDLKDLAKLSGKKKGLFG